MPKSVPRSYSRYTEEALLLLVGLIRAARIERKLSAREVSERAGISRSMLQRIEKADPKCEIGAVFEVAAILDVKLFDPEATTLKRYIKQNQETLSLLPQRARQSKKAITDDF